MYAARGVWLERAVVLADIAIVILPLFVIAIYAIHKIKPGWLRIHGSVLKALTFSLEIGKPDDPGKPGNELEPGRDDLQACRPGLSVSTACLPA